MTKQRHENNKEMSYPNMISIKETFHEKTDFHLFALNSLFIIQKIYLFLSLKSSIHNP